MTYFIFFQFQIEHQAHGAKSNDPVMNCDNDDQLILKPGQKLSESNVRHETEIAFFKLSDYQAYLKLKESAEKQWILTRKRLKNSKKKPENGAINSSSCDYTDFLPNILRLNSKC